MSGALVVCPSCGLDIPKGSKYCKYCGAPLPSTSADEALPIEEPVADDIVEDTEPQTAVDDTPQETPLPSFDLSVQGVDGRSLAVLFSRAELAVLDHELDDLIDKIRATRQALKLDNADTSVLASRAEMLRESVDRVKSRRRELQDFSGQLPLERLLSDIDTFEQKIEKLKEIQATLDKEVYSEKRDELDVRLKAFRSQLKALKKLTKEWIKALKRKRKELNKEISRLEAKYKIGDIGDSQYEKARSRLDCSMGIIDGSISNLDKILEEAKNY